MPQTYIVGQTLATTEGYRLFPYTGRCPNTEHASPVQPFSTRALKGADGIELTAEACEACGRIAEVQRT